MVNLFQIIFPEWKWIFAVTKNRNSWLIFPVYDDIKIACLGILHIQGALVLPAELHLAIWLVIGVSEKNLWSGDLERERIESFKISMAHVNEQFMKFFSKLMLFNLVTFEFKLFT